MIMKLVCFIGILFATTQLIFAVFYLSNDTEPQVKLEKIDHIIVLFIVLLQVVIILWFALLYII